MVPQAWGSAVVAAGRPGAILASGGQLEMVKKGSMVTRRTVGFSDSEFFLALFRPCPLSASLAVVAFLRFPGAAAGGSSALALLRVRAAAGAA